MRLPRRSVVVYSIALVGSWRCDGHSLFARSDARRASDVLDVFPGGFGGRLGRRRSAGDGDGDNVQYSGELFVFQARGHWDINSTEELCGLIVFLSESLLIGVLGEVSLKSIDRAHVAEQQKDDFLAILAT